MRLRGQAVRAGVVPPVIAAVVGTPGVGKASLRWFQALVKPRMRVITQRSGLCCIGRLGGRTGPFAGGDGVVLAANELVERGVLRTVQSPERVLRD
jgi:hypothetical protein